MKKWIDMCPITGDVEKTTQCYMDLLDTVAPMPSLEQMQWVFIWQSLIVGIVAAILILLLVRYILPKLD